MSCYLIHLRSTFFHYFIDCLNIFIILILISHLFLKYHYFKLTENFDFHSNKIYYDLFRKCLVLALSLKIIDYYIISRD